MYFYSSESNVRNCTIGNLPTWIDTNDIEIPEIQKPFVWDKAKVRNLIDSLYREYSIGYLMVWKKPTMKLRNGNMRKGAMILIDGQQRVTALITSLLEKEIVNKEYKKERTTIAFHPIKEEFEVLNPAILKDPSWISDIASIVTGQVDQVLAVSEYCRKNSDADSQKIEDSIEKLIRIREKQLGIIELESDIDDFVFERILLAKGFLNQENFVMSMIAAYGDRGFRLRKLIDHFCNLVPEPKHCLNPEVDEDTTKSGYLKKTECSTRFDNGLYNPSFSDLLQVICAVEFNSEKIEHLVSRLSGRNSHTKMLEESIQEATFQRLEETVHRFTSEQNFNQFIRIVCSTGFIESDMINTKSTKNTLNFAYAVYLKLCDMDILQSDKESFVRKWFVMIMLTARYSDSADITFASDLKSIAENYKVHLKHVEDTKLSPAFWNGLKSKLETSNFSSPYLNIFFASQIRSNSNGFLSKDFLSDLRTRGTGNRHHIFPINYLKDKLKPGYYNQIANLVYTDKNINECIEAKLPSRYFDEIRKHCSGGPKACGDITDMETLKSNMKEHCIPESIFDMSIEDYPAFLEERRKLMAKKIEDYYKNL